MKKYFGFLVLLASVSAWSADSPVTLSVSGLAATLDNGLVKIVFAADASAKSVTVNNDKTNLVENLSGAGRDPDRLRSFYLDYHSLGVTQFKPEALKVIEDSPDRAHIAWEEKNSKLYLEYHMIMEKGERGIYSYVIARNTGDKPRLVSELRTIYRFNQSRLNKLYTAKGSSEPMLYEQLEKMPLVQDETWRLPNGSIYTKYDLVDYQRTNDFWGAYGSGFGAWFIPVNHDYFSGGPLKQDLMVHQDAIILNYMTGAHMGTPDMIAPPKWEKMYGPWLVYFNQGDERTVLDDAAKHAKSIQKKWPFAWVNEKLYPQKRGEVSGQITGHPGEIMNVVISPVRGDPEIQTMGYLYATQTNKDGDFNIASVRPGTYALTVYSQTGVDQGNLLQSELVVPESGLKLGKVAIPSKGNYLWHIGLADKTASGFKLSDLKANTINAESVPAELEFQIGKSKDSDWYYAQNKPGEWKIKFDVQNPEKKQVLNVAFAAASVSGMSKGTNPRMIIMVNGEKIADISYPNDKTIYRGGLKNGLYHNESLEIPAGLIKKGQNVITFKNQGGSFMYDAINLEVK